MYITKSTKQKDLPKGNYTLICENYCDNQKYFLINGKLAKNDVFNTAYALANDKVKLSNLKKDGLYKAHEIPQDKYKLFNL